MPSRKRNKGRSRRAKAAAAAAGSSTLDFCEERYQGSEERGRQSQQQQMSQLLRNFSINKCDHGFLPSTNANIRTFMRVYKDALTSSIDDYSGPVDAHLGLLETLRGMDLVKMLEIDDTREIITSQLVTLGADYLLGRQSEAATVSLAILSLEPNGNFETNLLDPGVLRAAKYILDGDVALELTRFYSKRIKCDCLKEQYKQLKKCGPKVGTCGHCKKMKERKNLMVCCGCDISMYCDVECQRGDWPKHKVICRIPETGLVSTEALEKMLQEKEEMYNLSAR